MLSKSKFMKGQQCHKALWLNLNGIKPSNPTDASLDRKLDTGNKVGVEAKKLFPKGIDIPFLKESSGYQKMCDLTQDAIKSGNKTIYEASFIQDNVFIRVDIMHLSSAGWDICEVKSSTSLRTYHKEDVSLQWHILKKVDGLKLNRAYVATLDKNYCKDGEIEPEKLFIFHDVSAFVQTKQTEIKDQISELHLISNSSTEPKRDIGNHCKTPHSCEYFDRCWPKNYKDINSIFRLYGANLKDKLHLFNSGIDIFEKVDPNTMLKSSSSRFQTQLNQLKANTLSTPIVDKLKIKSFVNKIKYPISYLDFEAFADAIPVFNGQKPYMPMVFQYSLHIQVNKNCELDKKTSHFDFIAPVEQDPRRALAESLLENIPKDGTIMAYYKSYEMTRIRELAECFSDLSSELYKLNERFIDLRDLFTGGGYYNNAFGGSFSLKHVLPALCPNDDNLDYKKLEINNGSMASEAYLDMRNQDKEEASVTRKKLFEYCLLDTYAMYGIYSKILKFIK